MIEFPIEVTKEFILSKLTEEEIFEKYGEEVVPYMFRSTLRADRKPTCKFYRRGNGKLILRDYSGDFWGDCFDYVMRRTGKNFFDALEDIAKRFELISSDGLADIHKLPKTPKFYIESTSSEIRIKRMGWTEAHLRFWRQYGVSKRTLNSFRVFPLERAWLNDEQVFYYGVRQEVAFAYHFPEYGPYEYKLYFPERLERRFLHTNGNILQGFHLLPERGPFMVVTKSYKDVIALSEFGVPACAPMAETQIVQPLEAYNLQMRFNNIFSLYDADRLAGIQSMKKMRKEYAFTPLFFNVKKGQPKDFTDFIKKSGVENARLLIDYVKSIYLFENEYNTSTKDN